MRKVLIGCLLLLVVFAGTVFAQPRASIDSSEIDLGVLSEDKVYNYELPLTNTGSEVLVIDSAMPSCGCIEIVSPQEPQEVSPGKKTAVRFTFDAAGMIGPQTKEIFIRTNDFTNPVLVVTVLADVARKTETIVERFRSFGIGAVVGAGLIDGINPCAFTVLIFFMSFLAFVGYSRKQMVVLGSFFILAVFLTYLAIGLGLLEFFRRMEIFLLLSRLIFYLTALLAFVLGVVSLWDWWIFTKTKDSEKVILKLPDVIKRQIHGVIREKTDDRKDTVRQRRSLIQLVLTAVSCGFIVSILESVCTGQLYLPTIVFVLGVPELKTRALLLLLLYNAMFIVPLLAIFIFALLGVSSEGFAKIARMHLAKVKFITAIVFFGLALSLLLFIRK